MLTLAPSRATIVPTAMVHNCTALTTYSAALASMLLLYSMPTSAPSLCRCVCDVHILARLVRLPSAIILTLTSFFYFGVFIPCCTRKKLPKILSCNTKIRTNSLTFLFSIGAGRLLGEPPRTPRTYLGLSLIAAGVILCIASKQL